jgi:hypothetical protein
VWQRDRDLGVHLQREERHQEERVLEIGVELDAERRREWRVGDEQREHGRERSVALIEQHRATRAPEGEERPSEHDHVCRVHLGCGERRRLATKPILETHRGRLHERDARDGRLEDLLTCCRCLGHTRRVCDRDLQRDVHVHAGRIERRAKALFLRRRSAACRREREQHHGHPLVSVSHISSWAQAILSSYPCLAPRTWANARRLLPSARHDVPARRTHR